MRLPLAVMIDSRHAKTSANLQRIGLGERLRLLYWHGPATDFRALGEDLKSIAIIAGARPNFMKIAPIIRAIQRHGEGLCLKLIHTGQHYDAHMSDVFFSELGIPPPDVFLGAGSGSHAQQTAKIMLGFEKICIADRPDFVLVVGDVNSTLACAIVAKKLNIPVAHVEAGLRSGDLSMPEEINRIVTDSISDLFFVTEPSGVENLLREGKPDCRIHYVGNVMVDNLLHQRNMLERMDTDGFQSARLQARLERYGVVTLHRPSNVDSEACLANIVGALNAIAQHIPLIFPVHPRTRAQMENFRIAIADNLILTGPLPYMEFLNLWQTAQMVLTDSGGLQEETTALGVPCITLRENTERPITIEQGTNVLAGTTPQGIVAEAQKILRGEIKSGQRPDLWDGRAAERIVAILSQAMAEAVAAPATAPA